MTKNKYLSFFFILIITFTASAIGGFVTTSFKEPWYSGLILPSFNPPSTVFAPVWTLLYILMSLAIWRIWINYFDVKILRLYFLHLFFNGIWSILFFGFHLPFLALVDIVIILFFIFILIRYYYRLDKISYYLTIPYLIWSLYAFVLNLSIVILNN
jgi:benzodiazapine receptor|tara:strand:- start:66 stop:533 length:468 start_codon:yes stop_codon:yes gene_type:complete